MDLQYTQLLKINLSSQQSKVMKYTTKKTQTIKSNKKKKRRDRLIVLSFIRKKIVLRQSKTRLKKDTLNCSKNIRSVGRKK